jgi:ligand-binding SRPBCC domain-containing protein
MPTFESSFTVRAPLARVAQFHHDARALQRLTPPPIFVQLHHVDPLAEGSRTEFTLWVGLLPLRWRALHTHVDRLRGFVDVQAAGPMKRWVHTHTFSAGPSGCARVSDRIEFEHQGGWRGWLTRVLFVPLALQLLFLYRRRVTRQALEANGSSRPEPRVR